VGDVGDGFWIPDQGPGGYLLGLCQIILVMGIPDVLQVHGALACVGLLALALWAAYREQRWVAVILMLVPVEILIVASEVWRPVFLPRALLPSLPFLSILIVSALARMAIRYRRVILAVLVPLLCLCTIWQTKAGMGGIGLARRVSEEYRDGDVIYHANLASYILLSYYLPEPEYQHAVWPDAGNLAQALSIASQEAMGIPRTAAAEVEADRLLVLWIENPMTTAAEVEELHAALETGPSRRLADWTVDGSELARIGLWEVQRDSGVSEVR
jgi:hypothetical protein